MRSFIALIVISALTISASAFSPLVAADQLFDGLTTGFNYSELHPDFIACKLASNDVTAATSALLIALQTHDTEGVARSIENLGANLSNTVRVCSETVNLVQLLVESIEINILSLDQSTLVSHFILNLATLEAEIAALRVGAENQDFFGLGQSIAQLLNLVVYGAQSTPSRVLRQLEESNKGADVTTILNTVFSIQGFLEKANTTVAVQDYVAAFNNIFGLFIQLPLLEQAMVVKDISGIARALSVIVGNMSATVDTSIVLKNEVAAWIARDLPYFENTTRLERGITVLTSNIPQTLLDLADIIRQKEAQEFVLFGNAIAKLYNTFYAAVTADL